MSTITTATMETTDTTFTAGERGRLLRRISRVSFTTDTMIMVEACLWEGNEWTIEANVSDRNNRCELVSESFKVRIANITDDEREAIENECIEEAIENAVATGWKVAA